MQINDTAITLTEAEIADRRDRTALLVAIASVAAQETVTPPEHHWQDWDVHGVGFAVVRAAWNITMRRPCPILGVQLKVEQDYHIVFLRRVMLTRAGTLDITKLRKAYEECRAKADEVAAKDAEITETNAAVQAKVAESTRRALLYPDLVAALELLMSGVKYVEHEGIDHNFAPHVLANARAVIARCKGGAS